jgi:hypothetical protein
VSILDAHAGSAKTPAGSARTPADFDPLPAEVFSARLVEPPPQSQPWYAARIAPELRPVREDFVLEWREATIHQMAARTGSTLFRESSNKLDVRWRLVEAGWDPAPLGEGEETRIVNLSLLGAGLGLKSAVNETLDRSIELGVLRRILGVATAPSFEVRPGSSQHGVRLSDHSVSRAEALAAAGDEIELRRDVPSVRVGSGFHLVGSETDETGAALVLGTFVQVQHVGVDLLRLEMNLEPPGEDAGMLDLSPPTELGTWMAVARQDLTRRVSIHGDLWGEGTNPIPQKAKTGINFRALPRTLLTTNVSHSFEPVPGLPGGEWTATVGLQSRLGWRLPQHDGRWNLGQVEGAKPSWAPDPRRGAPNELVPFVPSPAERYAPENDPEF